MPVEIGVQPFRQRFPWIGGDLQTLRDVIVGGSEPVPAAHTEAQRFEMPDGTGDTLTGVLDRPARPVDGLPLVVLIHGLTGSAESTYVRRSARSFLEAGFVTLRLNLRGAGTSRPLCRQQYHSGRSADLAAVIDRLQGPDGIAAEGVTLVGWSLGANMLLKAVAEFGAGKRVRGAVAISAPIDLAATARHFTARRNTVYHRHLLAAMRAEMAAVPGGLAQSDRARLAAVRSVIAFDDAFTAPRNGFADAADYYARNSASGFLARIAVPTRVIHALDDPWIPPEMYRAVDWERCPAVHATLTRHGGHVGFHGQQGVWSDAEAVRFLAGL
ncbi:alpha/beta fold hydrolase [Thalassobaculum sp. OXR-137]|uniref:YheT family hydrolase n=1 Tax=Thalassobaculum sp. OXR-137 TaxID=3100173 RepID=UPI002AC9CA99|nr:alpha/beta fold hydrolase [Thalassobaculum sp. OXR-137]WPZ32828.1 alpha/beta fold hydrolase [Thalassobaculum sp. OXR-137]